MRERFICIALLAAMLLTLAGCLGPKPVLQSYKAEPPPPGSGQPFRVDAVVSNQGPGEGQVQVEVSLTNKQNGELIARESKEVELQSGDTAHVLVELNLPPSAEDLDPESIEVEVDAHYPIQ
jgi:hypothetical protein